MGKRIVLIAIILISGYHFMCNKEIQREEGEIAPAEPVQVKLKGQPSFDYKGYKITPLATFNIEARVLGVEVYNYDRGAKLSPVDLALGWGPMSNTANLKEIKINQTSRFYLWRTKTLPIDSQKISRNSANMHMVPADRDIKKRLKKLRRGNIVEIEGYLIEIKGNDGFTWRSSLTRNDTGNHACELVYVKSLYAH